jgi:hypothetical protein
MEYHFSTEFTKTGIYSYYHGTIGSKNLYLPNQMVPGKEIQSMSDENDIHPVETDQDETNLQESREHWEGVYNDEAASHHLPDFGNTHPLGAGIKEFLNKLFKA